MGNDFKPEDWVDLETMVDPEATKPDDWDESEPEKIENMDAVKPSGWLDHEPEMIPDPEAVKPSEWDDDEDGEFEPQLIQNPKCDEVGCGIWTRPMMKNPNYKGKWVAPRIKNPDYIGEWTPKQIPNPSYFKDETPAFMAPFDALSIEVLTNQGGILFDNIIITTNLDEAQRFSETTFIPKYAAEQKLANKIQKDAKKQKINEKLESNDFTSKLEGYLGLIMVWSEENMVAAISTLIALIAVPILAIIFALRSDSKDIKREVEDKEIIHNDDDDDNDEDDEDEDEDTEGDEEGEEQEEEDKTPEKPTKRSTRKRF